MDIKELFKVMVDSEASDLYLTVARPPMYRIEGKIQAIGDHIFTPPELDTLVKSVMSESQLREYGENLELNMAMSLPGVSRFRVNVFRQRGSAGMVIRRVKAEVSSLARTRVAGHTERNHHVEARVGAGGRRHRIRQIDYSGRHGRLS